MRYGNPVEAVFQNAFMLPIRRRGKWTAVRCIHRPMFMARTRLGVIVHFAKRPYLTISSKAADGDPSRLQRKDRFEAVFSAQEKAKIWASGASYFTEG